MSMHRPLTARQIDALMAESQQHRAAKLQRDHELELLLCAGVSLDEARAIVDGGAA